MPWNYSFLKRRKAQTASADEAHFILPPITKERRFRRDVPYILPKDTDEIDRLDVQHHIMRATLNSNFVAPIDLPVRILDIGCGTGIWGFEMCQQFPQAQVVGLDLEPGHKAPPPNFIFVQSNILQGIPFENDSFDYVHQRFMLTALPLTIWPKLINEMVRVSMTGGWIELIEGSDEIQPLGPAMKQIMDLLVAITQKRGLDTNGNVPRFLDSMLSQAGLENVTMKTFDVPLGTWGGRLGEMMSNNLYHALKAVCAIAPTLLDVPKEKTDASLALLRKEWEQDHATYRYYVAYGQKGSEAPTVHIPRP